MRVSGVCLGAIAALSLAACASKTTADAPAAERTCFNADLVSNYAVVDSQTVNLRAGADTYQIKLLGSCPDLKWDQSIALTTAGSPQVCTGLDLTIIAQTAIGPQECAAESLRRLTPDEVSALPAGQKP